MALFEFSGFAYVGYVECSCIVTLCAVAAAVYVAVGVAVVARHGAYLKLGRSCAGTPVTVIEGAVIMLSVVVSCC